MRSPDAPPLPLSSYVGRYENALFGPVHVRLAGSQLTLQMGDGQIADLEFHGSAGFFVWWRDPLFLEYYGTHVEFTADGNSVARLTMRVNRDVIVAEKRAG